MTDRTLDRCRILVVEDEYLLADELSQELADEGATVIGPVASVRDAMGMIELEEPFNGAILDVNLDGETVFPVADALIRLGIPLIFTTGYDAAALPQQYSHVPRCEKPVNIRRITAALGRLVHA